MTDAQALARIDALTSDDYQAAFTAIRDDLVDSDFRLLKAHYEAPNYVISAAELAGKVGFANLQAANLRYGMLATNVLEFFQIHLSEYVQLNALVYLNNPNDRWEWTLRPEVVEALKRLKWFE